MSVVLESHALDHAVTRSTWRAVVALGLREGRRMLLSPVLLLLLAFVVLMGGVETVAEQALSMPTARGAYDAITFFTALYLGLLVYMAAHLVTSSARRAGAEPQLAASALSSRQRSVGLCLGVLFGPGGLALVLMTAAALLGNSLVATNADGFGPDEPPMDVVFLVQLGLLLVGGGLFGVMWATWLRFPGSLPIGFLVLVFGTVWLANPDRQPLYTWPWFGPYITVPSWFDEPWTAYGSHHWHTAYLVGLCALALCGTMLREPERRGRWLGISAAVAVATGVVGALQLS
jgi:hypothetical protein